MGQVADNYASKTQIENYGLLQFQKKKVLVLLTGKWLPFPE